MKFPLLFVASLLVGFFPLHPSTTQAADPADWTTYNYDATGSRHNTSETSLNARNVARLVEKWRFPSGDYQQKVGVIHATPSVVNGCVYFGTVTLAAFYKLGPSGKLKWKYDLKYNGSVAGTNAARRLNPDMGVFSSALVTDDAVYFADAMGKVYALDRTTGEEKWVVDARDEDFPGAHPANVFLASPILVEGKIVFAGGAYEHAAVLQPGYPCCNGRGCVVAFDPQSGAIIWKYDVGPKPIAFDPPLKVRVSGVERTYHYGPSTSSVWSTPSYDKETHLIYFGTDVHNAPRKPTADDPRNYTEHSAAIISLDVRDGSERWITQLAKGDIWNYSLPTYDREAGKYKDQSIGDTPKLYSTLVAGVKTQTVGVGSKSGGFYVLRAVDGRVLFETPRYEGPPVQDPEVNPRTLALPSATGGIQTGCATDGLRVFVNGMDALQHLPTGGRVTAISLDSTQEFWRHNRPNVAEVPRRGGEPFRNVGDPIASGIALANGVAYFTSLVSNKLIALDTNDGRLLKEIPIGPVFAGPSVSRGRVYVGSGNTLFSTNPSEDFFPKRSTGTLFSFGLPEEDEVDLLESQAQ